MLEGVDVSWKSSLEKSLKSFDKDYLNFLKNSEQFFPNRDKIFNAFKTLPKDRVKYILFGQDPYPREDSAIGYSFIDGRVKSIFSQKGLSKEVNRATSLRNFIKMALVADSKLDCTDLSQEAISKLDKRELINSVDELRINFELNGVLLLNTSLIFTSKSESKKHIKSWRGFIETLLKEIENQTSVVTLILFGNSAKDIKKRFNLEKFKILEFEHPYNNSFICNKSALKTFKEMELLKKRGL